MKPILHHIAMISSLKTTKRITSASLSMTLLLCMGCNDGLDITVETSTNKIEFAVSTEANQLLFSRADSPQAPDTCFELTSTDGIKLYLHQSVTDNDAPIAATASRGTTLDISDHESFGLLAGIFKSDWSEDEYGANYINNAQYSVSPGTIIAPANTTYFWPGDSWNIKFFAYAPYSENDANISLSESSERGTPKITYTVPQTVSQQTDLMLASADGNPADGKQSLTFCHALTAVKFVVDEGDNYGYAQSIAIKGVYSKATTSIDNSPTWQIENTTNDFTLNLKGIDIGMGFTASDYVDLTSENTFFMIPQTVPDDAQIEFVYTDEIGGQHTLTAELGSTVWQQGTIVTYHITSGTMEKFDAPEVEHQHKITVTVEYTDPYEYKHQYLTPNSIQLKDADALEVTTLSGNLSAYNFIAQTSSGDLLSPGQYSVSALTDYVTLTKYVEIPDDGCIHNMISNFNVPIYYTYFEDNDIQQDGEYGWEADAYVDAYTPIGADVEIGYEIEAEGGSCDITLSTRSGFDKLYETADENVYEVMYMQAEFTNNSSSPLPDDREDFLKFEFINLSDLSESNKFTVKIRQRSEDEWTEVNSEISYEDDAITIENPEFGEYGLFGKVKVETMDILVKRDGSSYSITDADGNDQYQLINSVGSILFPTLNSSSIDNKSGTSVRQYNDDVTYKTYRGPLYNSEVTKKISNDSEKAQESLCLNTLVYILGEPKGSWSGNKYNENTIECSFNPNTQISIGATLLFDIAEKIKYVKVSSVDNPSVSFDGYSIEEIIISYDWQ